ncbi:MAG: MFS transporter [Planctomycetota bacterium]|jgi:ACS family glucarate transporter-like MFS transporter
MKTSRNRIGRQRYILIVILFFHTVNTYMDRVCISSAKGDIMKDLQISDQMMGWIFGIFALGYALFQVPSGWFADRYGPRKALTVVVSFWSTFTALTGAAFNAVSMLIMRFIFGVGEAGAFPGATRAFYQWLPVKERGIAQGINFSGSRIGAGISYFLMPLVIGLIGWRLTFVANGVVGILWVTVWLLWFRDNPKDNPQISRGELDYIEQGRESDFVVSKKVSFAEIFTSSNMFLAMAQYFASNITFFICLSWLPSYLKDTWGEGAEFYAAIPVFCAATANWASGSLVTYLYKKGYHVSSRRIPAILGFALGAVGLLLATQTQELKPFIIFFSIAIYGVDMTLSPSWAFCMDIGGDKSGAVSGSMNMVGNIGSAVSAIIFPYFVANITLPYFAESVGTANSFFVFAAGLNVLAIIAWLFMNPRRSSAKELSRSAVLVRFAVIISLLTLLVLITILYKVFWMK